VDTVPLSTVLARSDIWRGDRFADAALPSVASGFAALDRELPGGGWPRGALTELLSSGSGQGELSLLLPALRQLCADDGWLVLVAPPHPLHAGAWAAAGIPLKRLLVVDIGPDTPQSALEALWAAEQSLSSDAPSAVLCWSTRVNSKAVRRLQLAAATSHAASFLLRPAHAADESSAATLRMRVHAQGNGLSIDVLKRRGPPLGTPLYIDLQRPAKWKSHEHSGRITPLTHGNALARAPSAAPLARRTPGLAVR
jgi:cell division inhibitor SulA